MKYSRCDWVTNDALYLQYHDTEWGKPVFDDRALFEQLSLELMQAGLSWFTILKKRENFRAAFHHFQPAIVAKMTPAHIDRLMQNTGIIRHRKKIQAIIHNAKLVKMIQAQHGSFHEFLWAYTNKKPIVLTQSPDACMALSQKIYSDFKAMGFQWIGAQTTFSFLQAVGVIQGHQASCQYHTACLQPESDL